MIVTYILRHPDIQTIVVPSDQIQYALVVSEAHSLISLNLKFLARLMEMATEEQRLETQIRMYPDHISITGPEEYLTGHPYLEEPADDLYGLWAPLGAGEEGYADVHVLERLVRDAATAQPTELDWTYEEDPDGQSGSMSIRAPRDRTFVTADYLEQVRSRPRGPRG